MISHSIVIEKPRIRGHVTDYTGNSWYGNRSPITSQELLIEYLKDKPQVGDWIWRFRPSLHTDTESPLRHEYQMAYVLYIEEDFSALKFSYDKGFPETHKLVTVYSDREIKNAWTRYEDIRVFRKLSREQEAMFLNDKLQDLLQEYLAEQKA